MKTNLVNSKDILRSLRFDGSFQLSDSVVYENVIEKHIYTRLNDLCSSIFTSGRNKRNYTTAEFGYPFLSNGDVISSYPYSSCKYSSKKYTLSNDGFLTEGMILTGRVGAIGQTAYVNGSFEKKKAIGSDNIIRIVCKDDVPKGFVYAFLTSKIGNIMLWKYAAGGVQPYITDKMVGQIPIPHFPLTFQKEVDDLIQESARLREEATEALEEAVGMIEEAIVLTKKKASFGSVSSKTILGSHNERFEANFHISEGSDYDREIKENYKWYPLGDVCQSISRPELFKRNYVKNGVTFLGGADIFLASPDSNKMLSKSKTPNIESLALSEGMILMPRSGTIGNVAWAHAGHAQKLASEDVIRIIPNDILRAGYVYAFLASKIGYSIIKKMIFGSVIQHVEPPHLKLIPVPVIEDSKMEHIHNNIMEYSQKMGAAIKNEHKAIHLVESAIEQWNKN